ncbi:hypothetical protein [Bacteroides reticulotermitis]|uniref:hypothetical protein n=1 Tax=Bacteroides reticulotermitis TaxID=1133319 RepID=UPI003A8C121C
MNEKLYFRDKDSVFVECLDDLLGQAKQDGLTEVTVLEAIPDDMKDYVWCTYHGDVTERNECRKAMCANYESKSGRGVCSNRGQLFRHGEAVTFKVEEKKE